MARSRPLIQLKSPQDIEMMARGGAVIGALFQEVALRVRDGVSTGELDTFCDDFIRSHDGAIPAFKGLYGFPRSVCISVNEEIVHGIPREDRLLRDGDIVSVDVGVKLDGWYSDSARTFPVGEMDGPTRALLDVTEASLERAVEAARVGGHVGDIGAAVVACVGDRPMGIIRDLVGHGIGKELHEEPQVPNLGRAGYGPLLREGMVVAIEPMISLGTDQIRTLEDGWTVVTADGTRAAHFEHTVAITGEGPRVLTGSPTGASFGTSI